MKAHLRQFLSIFVVVEIEGMQNVRKTINFQNSVCNYFSSIVFCKMRSWGIIVAFANMKLTFGLGK